MINIVIEGADGVGKSTLCKILYDHFKEDFTVDGECRLKCSRQPGGTELGEYIRSHVIFPEGDEPEDANHYTKRLGYIISHSDLAYESAQLLRDGYSILMDRFSPISNRVYERYGKEREIGWVEPIYKRIDTIYKPDLILYLRPEYPELLFQRWHGDKAESNYYDKSADDFKRRIITGYDAIMELMSDTYNIRPITIKEGDTAADVAWKARQIIFEHYAFAKSPTGRRA